MHRPRQAGPAGCSPRLVSGVRAAESAKRRDHLLSAMSTDRHTGPREAAVAVEAPRTRGVSRSETRGRSR
jgi:hypothetical protein